MTLNLINIPPGISEIRRDEHDLDYTYCLCDPFANKAERNFLTSVQLKHTIDKITTADRLII